MKLFRDCTVCKKLCITETTYHMNRTVYFMNICWNKLKCSVNSSIEAPVVIGWEAGWASWPACMRMENPDPTRVSDSDCPLTTLFLCGNKMPTRCNRGFYCRSYCLLNMFRASPCPSSGAQEYYTVVAACGISCCGFQVAGLVWS